VGADVPGAGTLAQCSSVRLNNRDRTAVVTGSVQYGDTPVHGIFRWANGSLTPVVLEGEQLPDRAELSAFYEPISFANEAGERAVVARLADGSTAAYLIDTDNSVRLLLRSGTSTRLGTISQLGPYQPGYTTGAPYGLSNGIGLNSKGQLAFTAKFESNRD